MKLTDDKKAKEQNDLLFENIEDIEDAERVSSELKKAVPKEESERNKGKIKMETNGVSRKCATDGVIVNGEKVEEEENEYNLNMDIKEQEKRFRKLTEEFEKLGFESRGTGRKKMVPTLDSETGKVKHGEKKEVSHSLFKSGSLDLEINGHSVKSSSVEDVTASMDKLGLESGTKLKGKDVAKPCPCDLKELWQGLSEEQTEPDQQNFTSVNLMTIEIIAQPEKKCEENEDFEETRVLSNAWDFKTDENRCSSFVARGPFGGVAKDSESHDLKEMLRKKGDDHYSDFTQPRKYVRPSIMEVYNPIMSGGYVQVVQPDVNQHSLYDVRHLEDLNISSQYSEQRPGNFLWPANSEMPAEQSIHHFYGDSLRNYQVMQHCGPYFGGSPSSECAVYPPAEDFAFAGGYEHGADTKLFDSELFPNYPLNADQGKNGMPCNPVHYNYHFHGHLGSQNIPFPSSHSPHDHCLTSPGSSPPSVLSYPLSPTSTILTNGEADLCDLSALSPGHFPLSPPESGFMTDDISGDASRDLDDAMEFIKEDLEALSTKAKAINGSLLPVVVEIAGSDPMSEVMFGSSGSPCQNAGNVSRPAEPKKPARQPKKGTKRAPKATQSASVPQMTILPPVTGSMTPNAIYSSSGLSVQQMSTTTPLPCFVIEPARSNQQQSTKPHLVPIRPKENTKPSAQPAAKLPQPADVSSSVLPRFSPPAMQPSPQEPTVTSSSDQDQLVKAYRAVAGLPKEQLLGQDDDGDTILHLAIVKEKTKLVKALLERYVREELIDKVINLANKQHQTPLCLAVFLNQTEIVKMLIERKADVNVQLQRKLNGGLKCYRLIHYAASRGKKWVPTLVQLLSADNIDLQAFNSEGCTAMHCAIECHGKNCQPGEEKIDSKDTIYHLAMRGADLNVQHGLCGKTPLHYAIEKKDSDLVGWFLGLASFVQSSDPKPSNGGRSQDLMHSLLNARPSGGVTALQLALGLQMEPKERVPILKMLLKDGAEVSQKGCDGKLRQELAKFPELTGLLKNGSSTMKNGPR